MKLPRDDEVPTLGALQRGDPKWCWLHCVHCGHQRAAAFAPYVIRWGPDASSNKLRRGAKCSKCGGIGADLGHPSWRDSTVGFAPFPSDQD